MIQIMLKLLLYIQPNAKQTKIVGAHNGRIKIQITAPAVDNKANAFLIKWLAGEFQVPRSRIILLKGAHSRLKDFEIDNPKCVPKWLS